MPAASKEFVSVIHMNLVTKAIIPVAGLGTRMLPATKAVPKEMLTLVDKPLIQNVVEECISAGIKDIILVTHSSKNAIENHFDTNFELEATLEDKVKYELLNEIKQICPKDVSIMSVRQHKAAGLGDAILCAYPLVGEHPFAVVLPDVIIDKYQSDLTRCNLACMLDNYNKTEVSQIMVAPVPWSDIGNYGIANCQSTTLGSGKSEIIVSVVEKPEPKTANSNLAIVGRYVLSPFIWSLLGQTQPGAGGEIQLTDAISDLIENQPVAAFAIEGKNHDCGNKLGYAQAFVEYAIAHPTIGNQFSEWLKKLIN